MADYKIQLGVDLKTSEIRTQVSNYNKNSNNAKLKLGVKLDTKGISEQIRAINSKTPVKVSLKLDTKNAQSQINNIKKQIQQLGGIKINFGGYGTGGRSTNNVNNYVNQMTTAYNKLRNISRNIGSIKVKLNGLDVSKDVNQIEILERQLQSLTREYHTTVAKIKNKGDLSSPQWQKVQQQIDNTKIKLEQLKGSLSDTSATQKAKAEINNLEAELKELNNVATQMSKLETSIFKLDGKRNANEIQVLENQLNSLRATYDKLISEFNLNNPNLNIGHLQNLDSVFANTENKIAQLKAKVADARAEFARKIEIKLESGKFSTQVQKINSDVSRLSNISNELRVKLDALNVAERTMNLAFKSDNIEQKITAYKKYEQALISVKNQLKQNKMAEQDANALKKLADDRALFQSKIDTWLTKNSASASKFSASMLDLKAKAESCDRVTLNHLQKEFRRLDMEADKAGLKMQSLGDRIKTQFAKYSSYLSVASVFMYTTMAMRSMFNQVVTIDSAMTELKKVTDETASSYDKFLDNASSRAKEIGTTIDGLVSSTADFARLGYNFEDSQGLAEVANIYAVVGDEIEGVEDATESLISTMAAFKDEANDVSNTDFAMNIVDKFNEIGNKFAISSGGIGEALKRSASSLDAANNSIDESIALITAANTVVQNPEKVGNAFKTISMRIRGAKTELEEAGESTEGMAESTASMRKEIMALSGVDIMLNENTFKSTYQIMDELSNKWQDLSDIAQASIIELMAGKHQGNVFASLMANFETAREALEVSENSAGSAMKEHEKWSQSLEAKLLKLKATWQSLAQSFMSSNFLGGLLDGVTSLVNALDWLIDKFGALPTALGAFAGIRSLFSGKGIFNFDKDTKSIQLLGTKITDLKDRYTQIQTALSRYNSLSSKSASFQNAYNKQLANSSTSMGKYLQGLNGAKASFGGYISSLVGATIKTVAFQVATVALNTALTMGVSFLISTAISAISKWANAEKELAEKVSEVTSKYKEQHEALKEIQGDYDTENESSMISKYEKLSKGVDNLGRNVSLTADEYSEYQSIVDTIASQIPSLVSGYDEQGNALLSCKGNVEALTEAYEKLIHAQNQEILTNTGKIEKDFANTIEKSSGESFWSNGHGFWAGILNNGYRNSPISDLVDYELKNDTVKSIQDLLNATNKNERNKILNSLRTNRYASNEIRDALTGAGIKVGALESPIDVLKKQLEINPSKIKGIIDDYYSQFSDAVEEQKTIAQAVLSEAFDISDTISGLDYGNISEELQQIASQTISSLDYNFLSELSESGKSIEQWTKEMLTQLNSLSEVDSKQIEAGFEFQTKFNGGEISYGEYVGNLRNLEETIDRLDLKDEVKEQLKISVGLDDNGVVDQYDALLERLTSKEIGLDNKIAKNFLNSLSVEELGVLVDIIPKLDSGATIDEIQALIDEKLATEFTFDISVETTGIEALNTALSEARSATGLTAESISALKSRYEDLEGFNAEALFERTANGVRLNNDELARLESQYENINNLDINKNLNNLIVKYNELTEKIKTCTDAQEKESLQLQADAYADKIKELQILSSQYEGLTSAFNKWQTAQSSANDGDNYDSLYEGLEGIKELYKKGLVGTDDFKTAVQLMTNKDLSNAGIDEIVSAYEKGYPKMQRYFTEGQKGCKNFLNDVSKLNSEWAHMNKDGSWEINFNAEEVAKELNTSVDAVNLIASKLRDYGFEVNLEDNSVDNLQTKIEKIESKVKELGQTPYSLDLTVEADAKNLDTIESEINNLKSHISEVNNNSSIDIDAKTALLEDAQAKLEVLIQKKQEASQPSYMSLDTSQVNASLVDALEKVQSYQNAINEVNKLSELKEAGIVIDDSQLQSAKEKVDECAKAIQGLDGEVKMAIGLEEDGSIESIKKSFEEGKVKIDVDADPAFNKIEQLAKNVEKIEDKDVTINVTVNGLDKVKELNRQIDLATDIDGDIDKLSEYVEGAKALSELSGNITSHVTANISGNVTNIPEFEIDNLKVFADNAKGLKDVGSFTSNVTANINGNVKDTPEYSINNLKVFTDSAKDIKDVGVVESSVKADIDGNVKDTPEYMINNLKTYSDSAKDIRSIGEDVKSKVTANIKGNVIDTPERSIDNLKVFTDSAKDIGTIGDIKSNVEANLEGNVKNIPEFAINNLKVFTDNAKDIESTGNVESTVKANVEGNVTDTFEYKLDNLKKFTDSAINIKKTGNVESNVSANVDGNVTDTFEYKIDNLKVFTDSAKDIGKIGNVESTVEANVKGNVQNLFEEQINNLKVFTDNAKDIEKIGNVESNVKANVEGNIVDTFEYKIDNLKIFTENAKDVGKIGNVESIVKANVEGNVVDTFEYKLDNLKKFTDSAKDIGKIGNVSSKVKANIEGNVIDTSEYKIDNLKVYYDSANNIRDVGIVKSSVTADVEGNVINTPEYMINNLKVFTDSAKDIESTGNVSSKVEANLEGNVTDIPEYMIDNLKVFTDNAKNINNIGENVKAKITADIEGNVKDTAEYMINNLKVFVDSAKNIKNVGEDTKAKITADIGGNVISTPEYMINNLKVFTDSAKNIKNIDEDTKAKITANIEGNVINTSENKIDNLGIFGDNAKKVKNIGDISSNVSANVEGNVISTYEVSIDNLGVFADNAEKVKGVGNFSSSVTASVNGNVITDDTVVSDLEHFASVVSGLPSQTVTVSVNAKVDSENVNTAIQLLKDVSNSGVFKDYNATVQVGATIATLDDSVVQNYNAPKKDGKVSYSVDEDSSVYTWVAPKKDGVVNYEAEVEALTHAQRNKTGTITYKAKITGLPVVNGTANANGSAFANGTVGKAYKQGDWGVKQTTTALTGELGQELVVYKNRFWTVGDNGAEFATIPKGAIVFNHKQTAELFANGKVTSDGGRGRAFVDGNAFIDGGGKFYGGSSSSDSVTVKADTVNVASKSTTNVSSNSVTGKTYESKSSSDDSKDKFEETIDWIEVAIERTERAIDRLDTKANSVYRTWSERNNALTSQISEVGNEIELQQKAYDKYMSAASGVGLSSAYAEKVRNGTIDIETITDEVLKEKIDDYTEWYNKALDCKDAILELTEAESELYAQRFENIQSQYDAILQGYEHTESMLNEYISQAEEQGYIVSKKYYQALIDNEKSNIAQLKKEQQSLIDARDEAVESGTISKYSEEWYNMCNEIDSVTQAIEESTTALLEFDNAMRDIDWSVFDLIQERISDVTSEADFLIELMSNDKLFDDNGKFTEQGVATVGLHAQNYNSHMYQADTYGEEIAKLNKQIESDPYDQELINRRNELIELQYESILSAEQEKDAIVDLVEEGIKYELDALQDVVDKKNEQLQSEKDLYDYQQKVEKSSKNIASLRKQISAYEGFDDEETKARVQELKVSLEEAEKDLKETEWDRYIDQQSQILDTLYTEYETILNQRLDNVDFLLEQVIDGINIAYGADGTITTALGSNGAIALALGNNATTIGETLKTETSKVGITLSNAMNSIWNTGDGNAKSVLTMYGEDFKTKYTTLNTTLNSIKSSVNSMVSSLNKESEKKTTANKTTTSAQKDPTKTTTTTTNKTTSTTNKDTTAKSGDGTPKVGDKVKFVSGKYYYDSQGKTPLGSKYQGKEVYITNINKKSWATHPYHISTGKSLGSGDLGWLKLDQISGYASGGRNLLNNEVAWTQEDGKEFIVRPSDGAILTPIAKGDSVLNASASNNIWEMANSPSDFIKENLNLGATNIPNNSNTQNNYTQNLDNVVFSFPNVKNYNEMLSAMQKDKNFERMLLSMTIDRVAGKSSLAKGKSIR